MLTKPQFFYDHTTKQALGFQNPFYLKKAHQFEPKLYDGNVIEKTNAIVIHDTEENLMLAEESHFETRFVPQTELSAEQAFWSQNSVNSLEPTPSSRPTKVEVPKELPKFSMVNMSLKKLKHHLASFDGVIKERTMAIAITEGTWGFKHTKACFRDEIIPFAKALKDLFNSFDQFLVDELSEVQHVFHQMEQAVEQHHVESKTFEVKMNKVLNENERLLEQEKVFVMTTLKGNLRKLKGKAVVDDVVTLHPIDPKMLKVDVAPLAPKLQNNRTAHSDYIRHTQEQIAILKEIVKQGKSLNPLNNSLEYASSSSNLVSNKPMLSSTGVNLSTSASRSQPSGNSKKDKIQQTPSSTQKNKVEVHSRITTTAEVPLRKPITLESDTPKPVVTLVYSRKPKASKHNIPDFGCSKHMTGDRSQLTNFVNKFLGTVKFGNDHVAKIMGYDDYQIGNVMILRFYFVEGLGHNLFSVGQFCDSHLEVAFRQHTFFIRNLEDNGTSVARFPQQNCVVERRNHMLIKAACTMLIYAKALLFLWEEAVATTCYTQTRSIVHDSENLGKLQPKADISIFIGYTPTKKAFQIYNRHTRRIIETIHVDFDKLTAMASEQSSSGPALHEMTPAIISSGLVPNPTSLTPFVPPSRTDCDLLF
uniref:Integrase, catalytic region, zinc finger, CCHC-type, peptidase aspartic, catalytic n=1 Tax=Tanacetum cinerariifolium TaxID=118510 RepID=A0A6L2MY74_TANCI|nr:integrase, catalytic region, zinc finger, CCHC-type, peptidase aspartic, catalytic [Tanacetum cinerariifolium]